MLKLSYISWIFKNIPFLTSFIEIYCILIIVRKNSNVIWKNCWNDYAFLLTVFEISNESFTESIYEHSYDPTQINSTQLASDSIISDIGVGQLSRVESDRARRYEQGFRQFIYQDSHHLL